MRLSVATMLGFAAAFALLTASVDVAQARKLRRQAATPVTGTVTLLQRGANLFPSGPVYYGAPGIEYLGTDPDPFIRQQLLRDLGAHFGGAF